MVSSRMDLEHFLRHRLQHPLPGAQAHRMMIPDVPGMEVRLNPPPPTARKSAVLVPLVLRRHSFPDVLFTVRSVDLRSHGGQISFPGGRLDDHEDVLQAALREVREEIGLRESGINIVGTLTELYIPPSNSAVTPVVGMIHAGEKFLANTAEVHEIFTVPLSVFLDRSNVQSMHRDFFGKSVQWPMWNVHPTVPLWGATAMILSELAWIVREEYVTTVKEVW